jgi:hypothetical protein
MRKFKVSAEVIEDKARRIINLEDLGMTEDEWDSLPADKQQTALQEAFEAIAEPPGWSVCNWEQI